MSEIPKAYDPKQVEPRWYQAWSDAGCFHGTPQPAEGKSAYCVMIPPPNVTGILTMGHVLNNTIQDILVRRARLEGHEALWMPGTDHASIATQNKVEQALKKEGKHKRDLGREAFVQRTWEWSHEYGGTILKQLRALGASCDWERTAFTMDPGYVQAVLHSFVELYKRGYIYRGKRMVNWCPASQTALSDEEVEMRQQRGFMYRVRYEIVERPGEFIEINTTRPETIPGDTAVAFHPEDERYAHLKGCHVWRPLVREAIPLICDSSVDREFGSGTLKVTPAHDKVDYEVGLRHKLPIRDVLNPDGTLNELAGPGLAGLERFKGRKQASAMLKELGALIEEKPYENNIGYSERGGVPIEPRLTEQWWMRYPKIEEAKAAVRDGLVKFYPERWEKVYLHWLENIQDWCISRQLWWGQRIPVWYKKGADRNDSANWHVSIEGPADAQNWEQDEDVLDTWASSWLWPFATFGWPGESEKTRAELKFFYPTTDLVTGPDIIFFWVARMIMAGLEFMGEEKKTLTTEEIRERIPFKNVYFTGIIRDAQGRKMSKSLGNSPDPLDLISEYGADGLRFGIMSMAPKGQDILFSTERIEVGRNFCNKLWNASRFRQMSGPAGDNGSLGAITARLEAAKFDEYDQWILARTLTTVRECEENFRQYEFNPITQSLYAFFWGDFCDWYVEASKAKLQDESRKASCLAIQDFVLREVLLLLYPFCPHITEELWHRLGYGAEGAFMQNHALEGAAELEAALQAVGAVPVSTAVEQVEALKEVVGKARGLKVTYNLSANREVVFFYLADAAQAAILGAQNDVLKRLIGAKSIELKAVAPDGCPASPTPLGTFYLDLASAVDPVAERKRLGKELEQIDKAINGAEGKLNNESFTAKAPANVIDGVRLTLSTNREKRAEIERLLQALGG
ncbi:MAG: valine--tRNA ligase [Verrucomicrobiota bacterium]|nr:valine--tRNA ligase [Verrucomicrobiota bacterium]